MITECSLCKDVETRWKVYIKWIFQIDNWVGEIMVEDDYTLEITPKSKRFVEESDWVKLSV